MKPALLQSLPIPVTGERLYGVRCRMTGNAPAAFAGRYTSVASFTPSRIGAHSTWQLTAGVCARADPASVRLPPTAASAEESRFRMTSNRMVRFLPPGWGVTFPRRLPPPARRSGRSPPGAGTARLAAAAPRKRSGSRSRCGSNSARRARVGDRPWRAVPPGSSRTAGTYRSARTDRPAGTPAPACSSQCMSPSGPGTAGCGCRAGRSIRVDLGHEDRVAQGALVPVASATRVALLFVPVFVPAAAAPERERRHDVDDASRRSEAIAVETERQAVDQPAVGHTRDGREARACLVERDQGPVRDLCIPAVGRSDPVCGPLVERHQHRPVDAPARKRVVQLLADPLLGTS